MIDNSMEQKEVINAVPVQEKTLLQQADEAALRLEKAIEEHKAIISREEEVFARNRLGGRTEAGTTPLVPVEESPKDYAKKLWNGQIPLR